MFLEKRERLGYRLSRHGMTILIEITKGILRAGSPTSVRSRNHLGAHRTDQVRDTTSHPELLGKKLPRKDAVIPLDTLRDRIVEAVAVHVKVHNLPIAGLHVDIQYDVGDGKAFQSKRGYVKRHSLN